jgi:predicted carbohydrate-binding protein with CBM5 and CBM33 domain
MAWPTKFLADYLSGKGAEYLGRDMYDRAICAKMGGTTFYFAAVSETASTYADKATLRVRVPEFARSGDKIRLSVWMRQATSGTGSFRVRETAGPVNGTDATSTSSTDAIKTSEITIPDNTWAGALKTFAVQLKTAGAGTCHARGTNCAANFQVVPA